MSEMESSCMGIDLQVCLSSARKSKDKNYMKYLEDGYKLLCRMARRSASEEMKKPPHLTRHHLFDTIGFIDISKDKIYILQHNKNRPDMKDSNYNSCHFFASQCCKHVDQHSPDLVWKECKGGLHHFRRICCEKGKWFNNSINPKCNLKHAINTPSKCIESIKITQKASKRLRTSRDYCQHKYQQLLNQTGIEISEEQSDFIFNSKTRKDMLDYFQDEATQTITQSELIKYLAISTWDNAAKKKKSGKRSVRYCPIMIRFASYLKNKAGNAAYSFISEVFTLPAIRTLNEYDTLDGNAEDGFLHETVKDVEETFNSWEIEGEEKIHLWRRTGILKFDEMSIKEKILYN